MKLRLFKEVNSLSLLDHPSILKSAGYTQTNFDNDPFPTIVTEFATNGSLNNIINLENGSFSPLDWTFIKKIINIYGIASGLS